MKRVVAFILFILSSFVFAEAGASASSGNALSKSAVPSSWIYVGNEKEDVVDAETGRTIHYLTAGHSIDNQFHYSNGSWGTVNGVTYLFFQSSRNRPERAGKTVHGEVQIMAANVKTGELYYLTTIPLDDGPVEQINVRPYYASFNDVSKSVYFLDKGMNTIYAYDCLTGKQKMILALPDGGKARNLDDFADGASVRVAYGYTVPVEGGRDGFVAVTDFDRDLNLVTNRIVRRCAPTEALNHVELSPADKNMIMYKHHEVSGPGGGNKSPELENLYIQNLIDGTEQLIKINALKIGHMIWGKSGNYIYWSNTQAVGKINKYDWRSKTTETIDGVHTYHNQVSSDENFWVYDGGSYQLFTGKVEGATYKNGNGWIGIYNYATKQDTKYANIILAHPHPRHAHPQFSVDDSMISFVTGAAVTNENTRVAVMKVSE